MFLEKQHIMTTGITQNNWELTKERVEKSLDSFAHKPIVYFGYYTTESVIHESVIGYISGTPNIIIEENNVYADIFLFKKLNGDELWYIKIDNNKTSFDLISIEIFQS